MCGVHLIIDKKSTLASDEAISHMMRSTMYRGPDHQSFMQIKAGGANLFFACNQLHITDSSENSNQPFISIDEKDSSTMVYNGEVYNDAELRKKHLANSSFSSHSDTEVVFKMLTKLADEAFSHFNGMYGLCFYHAPQEKVLIARDPVGIKPLYYFNDDRFLIASSEIKAILASGLVQKQINSSAVYQYLQFRHCNYPETFFKNIFEVPPGTLIEYDLSNNTLNTNKITYQSQDKIDVNDDSPVDDKFDKLLELSLIRHLRGPLTTALCLSGGVDSTLLLAISSQFSADVLPSYTLEFSDDGSNSDYHYAVRAAKKFNSEFHSTKVDISILDRFDELVGAFDQPIGDSGAFATYILTELIAKDHKVGLTGAGADEMFAGYNRHRFYYQYLLHPRKLEYLSKWPARLLQGSMGSKSEGARLLNKLTHSIGTNPEETYNRTVSFTDLKSDLQLIDWVSDNSKERNMQQALQYDRSRYLVSDVLAITDKMSMLNSVELRTPFLDLEMRNEILNFPALELISPGRKWLLKKILKNYGAGAEILKRRKKGFGLPFGPWAISNPGNILDFLDKSEHLIFQFADRQLICDLYKDHKKQRRNHTLELWNLSVLAKWLDLHF